MRDLDRRSALIGTAGLIGLTASRAFAQSQGVSQAAASAVAASRAEHAKLAAAVRRAVRRPPLAHRAALGSRRASVPGHVLDAEGPAPARRADRDALQCRFRRALSRALRGDARLRLPRLEHALSRRRGPVHARARADRHRRRRDMAAPAGRRARRDPRQFRRRLADGRVSGRGDRADACTARCRARRTPRCRTCRRPTCTSRSTRIRAGRRCSPTGSTRR